jgi:hypothetical protein
MLYNKYVYVLSVYMIMVLRCRYIIMIILSLFNIHTGRTLFMCVCELGVLFITSYLVYARLYLQLRLQVTKLTM